MAWHTPERKAEQALQRYLQSIAGTEFDGVQFVTRFSNKTKAEPRIEITCEDCEATLADHKPDPGIWDCRIKVTIVSHYALDIDAVTHDELAGQVADKLILDENVTTLAAEIMKTQDDEDFNVFQTRRGNRTNRIEEHSLVTEQELVMRAICQRDG